jgi:putative MFS transporter
LKVSTGRAALFFSMAVAVGIVGRMAIGLMAKVIGRKSADVLYGIRCTFLFSLTAVFHSTYIGPVSPFLLGSILTNFFMDGEFGNVIPFMSEVWPNELRSQGTAIGATMAGVGKIIGPICVALIVGAHNLVTPTATVAGLRGAFLFFGACMAITAFVFATIAPEPHGKTLSEIPPIP